jgi:hypothetical protein
MATAIDFAALLREERAKAIADNRLKENDETTSSQATSSKRNQDSQGMSLVGCNAPRN